MTFPHIGIGLLLLVLLPATSAFAEPKETAIRVGQAGAPSAVDARTRLVLRDAVRRHLATAGLGASLRYYTVTPSLVQLRRYVEAGARTPKLICIVDLALRDDQGVEVASVRGSAPPTMTLPKDAVEAAALAAVERLPAALQAAKQAREQHFEVTQR